jgi:hypothetical protein
LRRELDSLASEIGKKLTVNAASESAPSAELHTSPARLVVQFESSGVSFSWLAARSGMVGEGRLLVIEWDGVVARARGGAVRQTATPIRERTYRAEASGPDDWRWRAEDAPGAAYSSPHLAAQWLAGASMTAHARSS